MKQVHIKLLFMLLIIFSNNTFSQNVGIGTLTPTLGKLEIKGVAGTGTTVAAFGTDGAGLSVQRDALGPIIGFNHYRDLTIANSQGKHFANGFAGILAQEVANGKIKFDMYDLGVKDGFTSIGRRALTIANNGNVGIRDEAISNITLYVPKVNNSTGSLYLAGTTYPSIFHFSANEDTYIRGGKDGSSIYINDIPNGNVRLGNTTTKVGININPRASLDVNGDVILKKTLIVSSISSVITSLDRQGASIIHFTTPGGVAVSNALAGIAGGVDGMIVHIMVDYPNPGIGINFSIGHESTLESVQENRIICGGNANVSINQSGGCTLIYDGISNRWRMIGLVQ
jgi:hypothetical protein